MNPDNTLEKTLALIAGLGGETDELGDSWKDMTIGEGRSAKDVAKMGINVDDSDYNGAHKATSEVYMHAASAGNGPDQEGYPKAEELKKKFRNPNNIVFKDIRHVVCSGDTNCNWIFVQEDYNVYLCYITDGDYYNLMRIYSTTDLILDVKCSDDGQRVYLLKANPEVLTAANTGPTKTQGSLCVNGVLHAYGSLYANGVPVYNFVII